MSETAGRGGGRRRKRPRKPAVTTATPQSPANSPKKSPAGSGGKAAATGGAARRKTPGKGRVQLEVSAGGVVYRKVGEDIEVVLASRRTRRGELAWGLAKGGLEEGESLEAAAVREVREETGLSAVIEESLGETRYFYVWEDRRIRKTVHFFLMRLTGGDTVDKDDEMEEIRWFPLDRALKRAAYRGEREVLGRAAELLR
jgi:8-oxo-dGTP pyrophosphatase MutT (NUDIX family)